MNWTIRRLLLSLACLPFLLYATPAPPCAMPVQLAHANLTEVAADLSWSAVVGATEYRLRFRLVGNPGWTNRMGLVTNAYALTGLDPGATYEWQARANCNGTLSNWSASDLFTTLACPAPQSPAHANVTEVAADLSWSGVGNATAYRVRFRALGAGGWNNRPGIPTNAYALTNLDPGVSYEWQARSECHQGLSDWGALDTFTTIACETPQSPAHANVTEVAAALSWSGVGNATAYRVRFRALGAGGWNNRNNLPGNTYLLTNLDPGVSYEWQARSECHQGLSDWGVLDTFTTIACETPQNFDAGNATVTTMDLSWEVVANATTYQVRFRALGAGGWNNRTGILTNAYALTNLTPGTSYELQVRSTCGQGQSAWSAPDTLMTVACDAPQSPAHANVTETTAALSWSVIGNATEYRIRFRPLGNAGWSSRNAIPTNAYVLANLTPGTTYEWQARSVCGAGRSTWSTLDTFTTVACDAPSYLEKDVITTTTISLYWNSLSNASGYRIRFRALGEAVWNNRGNITDTSYVLSNLTPCTRYQIEIRTVCGLGYSNWVGREFSTASIYPLTYIDLGRDTLFPYGIGQECFFMDAGPGADRYLWSTGDTTRTINYCVETSTEVSVTTYLDGCILGWGKRYVHVEQPDQIELIGYDRFGQRYNINDLGIRFEDWVPSFNNNNIFLQSNPDVQFWDICRNNGECIHCSGKHNIYESGLFRLYFADGLRKINGRPNPIGEAGLFFADNRNNVPDPIDGGTRAEGMLRKRVLCRVFTDLSQLIQPGVNYRMDRPVNILVAPSTNTGNFLARGSSFYFPLGIGDRFLRPEVEVCFNDGFNSYGELPLQNANQYNDFFDGFIQVDFGNIYNLNYNGVTPANERDLYSAVLREALHILGVSSFLDEQGNGLVDDPLSGLYTTFDAFLKNNAGDNVIQCNSSCGVNVDPDALSQNCTNGRQIWYDGGVFDLDVFTTTDGIFRQGESLTHFFEGNDCSAPGCSYTLCRGDILTDKRAPLPEEASVLCDLGYIIDDHGGNGARYGVMNAQGGRYRPYEATLCQEVCHLSSRYQYEGPIAPDDIDGLSIDVINGVRFIGGDLADVIVESPEIIRGDGLVSMENNRIRFYPYLSSGGVVIIKYRLRVAEERPCGGLSTTGFIFITVGIPPIGELNCCKTSPPGAPVQIPPKMDYVEDPCNMVCYGAFEGDTRPGAVFNPLASGLGLWGLGSSSVDLLTTRANDLLNAYFAYPNRPPRDWTNRQASPNVPGINTNLSNFIGTRQFNNGGNDGPNFFLPLCTPLVKGQEYELTMSIWHRGNANIVPRRIRNVVLNIGFTDVPPCNQIMINRQAHFPFPINDNPLGFECGSVTTHYFGIEPLVLVQDEEERLPIFQWNTINSICFTARDNANYILLYPETESTDLNHPFRGWADVIFLDDIAVRPVAGQEPVVSERAPRPVLCPDINAHLRYRFCAPPCTPLPDGLTSVCPVKVRVRLPDVIERLPASQDGFTQEAIQPDEGYTWLSRIYERSELEHLSCQNLDFLVHVPEGLGGATIDVKIQVGGASPFNFSYPVKVDCCEDNEPFAPTINHEIICKDRVINLSANPVGENYLYTWTYTGQGSQVGPSAMFPLPDYNGEMSWQDYVNTYLKVHLAFRDLSSGCQGQQIIQLSLPAYCPGEISICNATLNGLLSRYGRAPVNGQVQGGSFTIEGTLIVDQPITFNNVTFNMGPEASIQLNDNFDLIFDACTLQCCSENSSMWQGVIATAGRVTLQHNSRLECAVHGLEARQSALTRVTASHLIDNLRHIYLNGCQQEWSPGTGPLIINGARLEALNPLHPPHASRYARVGVFAQDIPLDKSVTIGNQNAASLAERNLFLNVDVGVQTQQASIQLYANDFQWNPPNIAFRDAQPNRVGILFNREMPRINSQYNLQAVTSNTDIVRNVFTGHNRSILAYDANILNIEHTLFNNIHGGNFGYAIESNWGVNTRIIENVIDNCRSHAILLKGRAPGNATGIDISFNNIYQLGDASAAIYLKDLGTTGQQVDIDNNRVNVLDDRITTAGFGVWIVNLRKSGPNGPNSIINVKNNTIRNVRVAGISVEQNNRMGPEALTRYIIMANVIDNSRLLDDITTAGKRIGISVTDLPLGTRNTINYELFNNHIIRMRHGVSAQGDHNFIAVENGIDDVVAYNWRNIDIQNLRGPAAGISTRMMRSNQHGLITRNLIDDGIPVPNQTTTDDNGWHGVYLEARPRATLCQNLIQGTANNRFWSGITGRDNCFGSALVLNRMSYCTYGVSILNRGVLGPQYGGRSIRSSYMNNWQPDAPASRSLNTIFTYGSRGIESDFAFLYTTSPGDPFNAYADAPGGLGPQGLDNDPGPGNQPCSNPAAGISAGGACPIQDVGAGSFFFSCGNDDPTFFTSGVIAGMERVAQETGSDSLYGPAPTFQRQQQLYGLIHATPALRDSSTVLDSFYVAQHGGILDSLQTISDLVEGALGCPNTAGCFHRTPLLTQALALNSALPAALPLLENHRQVNHVVFTRLLAEVDTLSPTQMDTLKYVARQCPFSGGLAVYEARLSLMLAGQDTLDNMDGCMNVVLDTVQIRAATQTMKTPDKPQFKLYPNPAQDRITVSYYLPDNVTAEIQIHSMTGANLYAGKLEQSGHAEVELDIHNWASGVCVAWIKTTDGEVIVQKLVILK